MGFIGDVHPDAKPLGPVHDDLAPHEQGEFMRPDRRKHDPFAIVQAEHAQGLLGEVRGQRREGQLQAVEHLAQQALYLVGDAHLQSGDKEAARGAFQAAARGAFRQGYLKAKPVIQEPVMKVVVETPTEFQGAAMGSLNQRRGMIVGSQDEGTQCAIESQVPLAEMFGYSTVLRSLTQGKAQFTMEFATYRQVPQSVAEELEKQRQAEKKNVA